MFKVIDYIEIKCGRYGILKLNHYISVATTKVPRLHRRINPRFCEKNK